MCITEKMDGTNGCVIVENGEVIGFQSRKKLITSDSDNMGFAGWGEKHKEELATLGDGYHYGEWCGPGIQKNRHQLSSKEFYLFNVTLETSCTIVKKVPVLYQEVYTDGIIEKVMLQLLKERDYNPEGVMSYFLQTGTYLKATYEFSDGKWKNSIAS